MYDPGGAIVFQIFGVWVVLLPPSMLLEVAKLSLEIEVCNDMEQEAEVEECLQWESFVEDLHELIFLNMFSRDTIYHSRAIVCGIQELKSVIVHCCRISHGVSFK